MKRLTLVLAIGAIFSVAVGSASFADTNSDAKKAIQAINDRAMNLILKQDFKSLAKLCTPDCKFTQNGQTMSVDQMIGVMKAQMTQMKDMKMSSTVLTCSVKGGTATCTSHDKSYAAMVGPDKKLHKITSDGTSKSVFVKSGGIWLMKSNATISDKETMDGKPFDPSAMTGGGGGGRKQ